MTPEEEESYMQELLVALGYEEEEVEDLNEET